MKTIWSSLLSKPWRLWTNQLNTIVRMELRKNFFTRRGLWIYVLAFGPTAVTALGAIVSGGAGVQHDTAMLGTVFQFYYLRLAIFFGCMGVFTRLIRGEMVERSLHFYLLAPVKREILVLGKFIAGTVTVVSLFGIALAGSFAFVYMANGPAGLQYVFDGPGLGQLEAYLGITLLACVGYGALFLALSMVFRNPIVPGIVLLGWETINPILPALMQKFSVIFYLRHLAPVDVPAEGVFALLTVVTEPVPVWVAVGGVIALSAIVLVFACRRSRTLEIAYTSD
jgi:ABC-type transport system involved in multi-copper enzyme maturation permease subunit